MQLSRFAFSAIVVGVSLVACWDDDDESASVDLKGDDGAVSVHAVLSPFSLSIKNGDGREVLKTLSGGGDGLGYGGPAATHDSAPDKTRLLPGWDGYVPEEGPWQHGAAATVVSQTPNSATFELGVATVELRIEGTRVSIKTTAHGPDFNKLTIAYVLGSDEHFFGLGERYATVDHRGVSMYSWPEEGGTGGGEKVPWSDSNPFPNGPSMTYFPVPFFYSTNGYAMHLATTYRTETKFGSERPDAWRLAVNTTALETVIYVHDDPRQSLDDFTKETGRPFVPASWVFGPRRRVGNTDMVNGELEWKLLREKHVPTTQLDDTVHFRPANSQYGREDVLKEWTQTAHANGFKVCAYNNPYVSLDIDRAADDVTYGKDHGLFAMNPDGTVGQVQFISGELTEVATIDLTKPDGVAWFQSLLQRTIDIGYDCWMHDFGEYVRRPWKFGDGRLGDEVHDHFPVLSAKAAHDVWMKNRPDGDFSFYVRSGYTGSSQYTPSVWGGDPEATFDETQGMPAMLRGGINLGLSGVPIWGSDISGFKCLTDYPRDKEVYLRWAEVGAVSPMMYDENACSNPLGAREKWKLWNDQETIDVYAAMARLHTRMSPYWDVYAREANATGMPIMRHPFLLHPKEPEAWKAESTFYLGPSLWAAPIVERGSTVKDTWLPPGLWADFFDRTVYEGGKHVSIPAPLGKLPLLIADGGIVPLLDATVETLAPATDPGVVTADQMKGVLDVVVALSPGREAKMTLTDGTELVARRSASGDVTTEAHGGRADTTQIRWDVIRLH